MNRRTDQFRHLLRRLQTRTRAVVAQVAALSAVRFPGLIDPIGSGDRRLEIKGWVRTTGGQELTAVIVFIDGAPTALGRVVNPRDRTPGSSTSWRADIPMPETRSANVTALALFANGLTVRLDPQTVIARPPEPVEPVAPPPATVESVGQLDLPVPGSTVAGPLLTVAGWATVDPIARIEVTVDQRSEPARQMALPRPDVARQKESIHAAFCGFEHVVDISHHEPGHELIIGVDAVAADGARQAIGETVVSVCATHGTDPVDATDITLLRTRTDRVAARHRPTDRGVRLLAVTHDLGLGGGQLYLHELLLRLLEHPDLRCLVVSPTDGPLRHELESRGVEVHICGPFPTEPAAYESLVRQFVDIAGEFETTAVLVNTAGAMSGVELATRIDVPVLWAIHESYGPERFLLAAYGPGGAHPSAQRRLNQTLPAASAVIFEAESTRQLYCSSGDPRRFVKISYGIPLDEIDTYRAADERNARRATRGWDDDDIVLLCVGTLEPRKAQGSLIRAFAPISAAHPRATLVLVGDRGDPYSTALRGYADGLGLGGRLRIEPVTPDLYDWYAAADAFVLASDVESLPRSVLEAMAFGLPSIVADVFGLSDVIKDGVTGILVPPRDLDALENSLDRLLGMTATDRRDLGARGEAHVRAGYDSRGYAHAYRALIDGFATDPTLFPEDILDR